MDALIFGAGAQGRITAEILASLGRYSAINFLDDDESARGREIASGKILGRPEAIEGRERYEVVVALGHPHVRLRVAERLAALGYKFLSAVHPSAYVAPSATVGAGTVVCPGAIVHTGVTLGQHVIINTGAIVEHDTVLDDGVSISPRALISGRVHIGRATFIGLNALVLPRMKIGEGSVLGATSVANRDVGPRAFALGSPARVLSPVDEAFNWSALF